MSIDAAIPDSDTTSLTSISRSLRYTVLIEDGLCLREDDTTETSREHEAHVQTLPVEFVAPAEVSIRQYRALIDGVVKRLGDDLAIGREDRITFGSALDTGVDVDVTHRTTFAEVDVSTLQTTLRDRILATRDQLDDAVLVSAEGTRRGPLQLAELARPAERELDTAVTNITCLDILAVIAVGGRRERHEEGLILRIGLVDGSFEAQAVAEELTRHPSFP